MPADAADLSPKFVQVSLDSVPTSLAPTELRRAFVELERFQINAFTALPSGGATFGHTTGTRQLAVEGTQRVVTAAVELAATEIFDQVVQIFEILDTRLPTTYLGWRGTITSHLPVLGESAQAILDRRLVDRHEGAFAHLGSHRYGTGLRVLLEGGRGQVVVEPLLARADTLFVQYATVSPGQVDLGALRGLLAAFTRYHDHNVRAFVGEYLRA